MSPITLVTVHPWRSETSQNRLTENFGMSTTVPPTQNVDRNNHDSACVWNSGPCTSVTSSR